MGIGGKVVNLTASGKFPDSLVGLLRLGQPALDEARSFAERESRNAVDVGDKWLLSPITDVDKVICVGMNYQDHCKEQGAPIPQQPVIFSKFSSCITSPFADVVAHQDDDLRLDWEVELAFVISKPGKRIPEGEAMDHVLGYTVGFDVSERHWQLEKNGGQWLLGKSMDTFCPLGPAVVTVDELGDPHNLDLKCRVNGVTKQSSNTGQLIHRTQDIISFVSKFVTLLPGDVVLTGTPPGVGLFMKPPQFLKKGDVVECEIENIGCIVNRIA